MITARSVTITVLITCVGIVQCLAQGSDTSQVPPAVVATSTVMPKVFDSTTIEKEVSRSDFIFTEFSILKWKVLENPTNNEVHVDETLVIAKHKGQWALIHIGRNALDKNRVGKWCFWNVCHGGHKTVMLFNELPTEGELNAFEKVTWWNEKGDPKCWLPTDSCRVVASGVVCSNTVAFITKSKP